MSGQVNRPYPYLKIKVLRVSWIEQNKKQLKYEEIIASFPLEC